MTGIREDGEEMMGLEERLTLSLGRGSGKGRTGSREEKSQEGMSTRVLRWQDRRVTWQRQTRRWEAPREDGEQRAGGGTQAGQQQGQGGEEGDGQVGIQADFKMPSRRTSELQSQPGSAQV